MLFFNPGYDYNIINNQLSTYMYFMLTVYVYVVQLLKYPCEFFNTYQKHLQLLNSSI